MLDLDIGMNEWLVEPLAWDDARKFDRGKVMTFEELESGRDFGRYLDVDGDGIPFRTYPGTHPTKGAFFTRGTSRDRYARYSEEGPVYVDNMERLLKKFETAKKLVPAPVRRNAREATKFGAIYFGSTSVAMDEAIGALERTGIHLDILRLRAYPFTDEVIDFIRDHERVFLVEQNRDAQLRTLLLDTGRVDPARIVPVLHYDGTPITANFIASDIARRMQEFGRAAIRAVAS
jgi:2-oxoglutarate ferredoxin oxidoreductase subunit alpha